VGGLSAAQAQCVLPNELTNGQTADADEVMANFNALVTCLNGMSPGGSTNSIQYNSGAGSLSGLGPLTDGQVVIGSTAGAPQAQTLTAGSGVAITYGVGGISIATSGPPIAPGLYRQVMSATPTSAGTGLATWLNQGTSTVNDATVGITMDVPPIGAAVANVVGRYKTAPTAPYTIKALIAATRSSNASNAVGIGWYDGTNKLHLITLTMFNGTAPIVEVTKWNSPTSYVSADFISFFNGYAQPIWLQLHDDGTSVSFSFSMDGANFLPVFSTAKSSGFLGAGGYSNVIFAANPRGASSTVATILSWTEN
jgi:hypothetical protein